MKHRTLKRLGRGLLIASLLALGGCYTVEGMGRDMQAVGKGTSDAARSTGDALTGKR